MRSSRTFRACTTTEKSKQGTVGRENLSAVFFCIDTITVLGKHRTIKAAALGTTLSQAVSVAISLWVILHRKDSGISVRKTDFRPNKPVISRIFSIGLPVALQDGLIQVSFIIITIIANRRGLTDAAAVGIVEKIISFLFLIPSSMLSTVSALGAQNIGAGKKERAVQTLRYAIGISEERLKAGEFSQYVTEISIPIRRRESLIK